MLLQTYSNLEVIVIDDGSTDDTGEQLKDFLADERVRYQYQVNRGASSARNAGIGISKGEFVAFQDADDVWVAEKLEKQMSLFLEDPDLSIVYSGIQLIDENGSKLPTRRRQFFCGDGLFEKLLIENFIPLGSTVVKRECLEKEKFDEGIRTCHDYDIWLRLACYYNCKFDFVGRTAGVASEVARSTDIQSDLSLRKQVWRSKRST